MQEVFSKESIRLSVVGSVDDGKSTLMGRLLFETGNVYEDDLESVKDNDKYNWAHLLDGLGVEREQGITIDVAYRFFSTSKRAYIIADTPGHVQYTCNMVSGASFTNVSIILVNALSGITEQTRRHALIASLLNVPHLIVAVNKMDLVNYSGEVFEKIKSEFTEFLTKLDLIDVRFVPVCALNGDNIVCQSKNFPWYRGESLLQILESVHIASDHNLIDFRYPVQYVGIGDSRQYCGQIVSGGVREGEEVLVLPSRVKTRVKKIVGVKGQVGEAFYPMSISIMTENQIDISRGDMIVRPNNQPDVGFSFESMVVWVAQELLDQTKSYFIRHTTRLLRARVEKINYVIDVNNLSRLKSDSLSINDIGMLEICTSESLYYDIYKKNRFTGSFVLIDPINNNTVAAGIIVRKVIASPRDHQVEPFLTQSLITKEEREKKFSERAGTFWLTGLSGSGKSTLAWGVEKKLFDINRRAIVLDGDFVRRTINSDLGFSLQERSENIRRVASLAKLLNDIGFIVIVALISPLIKNRGMAKEIIGKERFYEVFVDASIKACENRDVKGLYKKAISGIVKNFTGVSDPYEAPLNPHLTICTESSSIQKSVENFFKFIEEKSFVK